MEADNWAKSSPVSYNRMLAHTTDKECTRHKTRGGC